MPLSLLSEDFDCCGCHLSYYNLNSSKNYDSSIDEQGHEPYHENFEAN